VKVVVAIAFLVVLLVLVGLAVVNAAASLRNLAQALGPSRPAFVREPFGTPEYNRRALLLQMVNLARGDDALREGGHLRGAPDPGRDFQGKPCWLRYEADGFYVDYADGQQSWRIAPVPPDVALGVCDGNGIITLNRAMGGLWGYDALLRRQFSDIPPATPKHPVRTLPFDALELGDAAHVAWLRGQRDPELWHAAAYAAFAYTDDPHGFLPWLVEQPELDRSTAGFLFLSGEAGRYLKGETQFYGNGMSGSGYPGLMAKLLARAEARGFVRDEIGLPPDYEAVRVALLAQVARGDVAADRIVPHALLDVAYPAQKVTGYHVEEGTVVL
jgi:hypothetical protein